MEKSVENQLSFEDLDKRGTIENFPNTERYENGMPIAFVNYIDIKDMTIDDIFDGFDDLKVMTFSSDLDFIESIAEKFKTMTVLLGSEKLAMSKAENLEVILASQKVDTLEIVKKHEKLVERALNDEISFKVARTITSHMKVFIMEAEDGRSRVLAGSMNFTRRGFSGFSVQMENGTCCDNDPLGYQINRSYFDLLKDFCMDEIPKESLLIKDTDDLNVDMLPFSKEVEANVYAEINPDESDLRNIEYNIDYEKAKEEEYFKQLLKEAHYRPEKSNGKTIVTAEILNRVKKTEKNYRKQTKQTMEMFPKLSIDYKDNKASLNGTDLKIDETDSKKVKENAELLLEYFSGFDSFDGGDPRQSKITYFKIMNFMFASPFMAMLRCEADEAGFAKEYFPYFAVVYGPKSAGKTEFVKTIQYMMLGIKIKPSTQDTFCKDNMIISLNAVEGAPICVDEVLRASFSRHSKYIIKCIENDISPEAIAKHGTYILTSNDIQSTKPDMAKRLYLGTVTATLSHTSAVANKKRLTELQKKFTTDFFRYYLNKMIPKVKKMVEKIQTYDLKEGNWGPDIFQMSSQTIIEIIRESGLETPDYMAELDYESYFGYNAIGEETKQKLLRDWKHSKNLFEISRRDNELAYSAESSKKAEEICDTLPEIVNGKCSGTKIIMKLDKTEEFLGIKIRKGIFQK